MARCVCACTTQSSWQDPPSRAVRGNGPGWRERGSHTRGRRPGDASPHTTIGGLRAALAGHEGIDRRGLFCRPRPDGVECERPSCLEIPLEGASDRAGRRLQGARRRGCGQPGGRRQEGRRAERHSAGLETIHESSGPHVPVSKGKHRRRLDEGRGWEPLGSLL